MVTCCLCRSENLFIIVQGLLDYEYSAPGSYTYWYCKKCGLLNINPLPTESILSDAYPKSYHAYHGHSNWLARFLKKKYWQKKASKYLLYINRDSEILDLGCGSGDFIIELKNLGFNNIQGLDFNEKVVQKARSRGLSVKKGELDKNSFKKESFDLIVMTNYIEHVFDPLETMNICFSFLKPGGILAGETPNTESWDFNIFKKYWGGYHTPRHLYIFSLITLKKLADLAGLEEIKISNILQPAHWALSVQNLLQDSKFKRRLIRGRSFYFTLLLLLFLPVNIIQYYFSNTSLVEFIFRKNL